MLQRVWKVLIGLSFESLMAFKSSKILKSYRNFKDSRFEAYLNFQEV